MLHMRVCVLLWAFPQQCGVHQTSISAATEASHVADGTCSSLSHVHIPGHMYIEMLCGNTGACACRSDSRSPLQTIWRVHHRTLTDMHMAAADADWKDLVTCVLKQHDGFAEGAHVSDEQRTQVTCTCT
jgi:hypothetical protein